MFAHPFTLVAVAGLVLLVWILPSAQRYVTHRRLVRKNGCLPPPSLPARDPILGLDLAYRMFQSYKRGRRSLDFKLQHEKFGSTFQSTALGKIRIFTIDPSNLRTIFSTNFPDWGVEPLRLPYWEALLGKGVMDTDGAFWKHSRDSVQPLFQRKQVEDLYAFDVNVSRLLELLPQEGVTVDLQPLFGRLVLDFTMEFLFGESCKTLTAHPSEDAIEFLHAFHHGQGAIGKRTQLPYISALTGDKEFWAAAKTLHNFADTRIERAASLSKSSPGESSPYPNKKYVLVDELVRTYNDRIDIRNQLLNTFLAAHDTTTVLITNTFFNLARYPAVYQKLRTELMAVEDPGLFYNADILKIRFPYLNAVVNETSRLLPVVGQSARIALSPTVLPSGGGAAGTSPIFVSPGTTVQFNFFALHRQREVWGDDADVFVPERWERASVKEGSGSGIGHWDFMPFGGGPRVCPAQAMAILQVKFVVARIVREYERVECRDPVFEFVERYRVTSDSKNGCLVGLIR